MRHFRFVYGADLDDRGPVTQLLEVGREGWAIRQLEVFQSGLVLNESGKAAVSGS